MDNITATLKSHLSHQSYYLYRLYKANGFNQTDMGKVAGCSQRQISGLVNDEPHCVTLKRALEFNTKLFLYAAENEAKFRITAV